MAEPVLDRDPNGQIGAFVNADGQTMQLAVTGDGAIPISMPAKSAVSYAQVDIGNDGTDAIIIANTARESVMITNIGAETVFLGNTTSVTATTGGALLAGTTKVYATTQAFHGICAATKTSRVSVEAL